MFSYKTCVGIIVVCFVQTQDPAAVSQLDRTVVLPSSLEQTIVIHKGSDALGALSLQSCCSVVILVFVKIAGII